MKKIIFFLILVHAHSCLQVDHTPELFSGKRNVFDFIGMVRRVSRLGFKSYKLLRHGNYCGIGGKGKILDPLDNCCKEHDECWSTVQKNCYSGYFLSYKYSVKNYTVFCNRDQSLCRKTLCECDKKCSYCFRENEEYLIK